MNPFEEENQPQHRSRIKKDGKEYCASCGKDIKPMKVILLERLAQLKVLRQEACDLGDVVMLQSVNYEIVGIAKKLNIDYYSI